MLPKTPCRWHKGLRPNDSQLQEKKKKQEENLENPFAFIDSNENILPAGGL